MTSTPSPGLPNSPLQSEKAKRYDRQLRLWGDHGQTTLEYSSVCLINATALGTEILKSLVLPGIGSFTILDPFKISGEDAGNNFFLDSECIGQSRGEIAMRLLLEMNHEVKGDFLEESVEQVLQSNEEFFSNFSLVIACGLGEKTILSLSEMLWKQNIPLLLVKTIGFLGYIRIQVREHFVVESHPDNRTPDLRLDQPWPELETWLEQQANAMDTMTRQEHSHTPYPVILHKYLKIWRKEHNGCMPANYKEKKQFKELIRTGLLRRESEPEVEEDEENFEEASRAVNTVIAETKIPSSTMKIVGDAAAKNITNSSHNFWLMANALSSFIEREGRLPVEGGIPDMFSDSDRYVQLMNVYRDKANNDAEFIFRQVQQLLESSSRSRDIIKEAEVKRFCKEARFIRLMRGSSIEKEYRGECDYSSLQAGVEDTDLDAIYYLILRAVERYTSEYGVSPGLTEAEVETDISKLKTMLSKIAAEVGISLPGGLDEHVHEVCRYGGSELHSVAAFLGGCSAHEVIKLLTGQYAPVNNIVIYNANSCNVSTFTIPSKE